MRQEAILNEHTLKYTRILHLDNTLADDIIA